MVAGWIDTQKYSLGKLAGDIGSVDFVLAAALTVTRFSAAAAAAAAAALVDSAAAVLADSAAASAASASATATAIETLNFSQMERAIDSLKYEGSISDAILEAKAQKKLLAVYISCEDENWLKWEQSTFAHPLVAEIISKYCVFLHLMSGSLGSSQFSAIYPQKAVPSISVVGYTGVLLWHESCFMGDEEGYVDARDIVNSIHKAWATLHLQETTATVSATPLASQGLECLDSSVSDDQTNTSEKLSEHSEHGQLAIPNNSVDQNVREMGDDKDTKQGKEKCTQWGVKEDRLEQSNSTTETSKEVLSSVGRNGNHTVICNDGDVSLEPQEIIPSNKSHKKTSETAEVVMASCSPGSSQTATNQVEGRIEDKKDDDHPVMFNEGDVSLEPQGNIPSDKSHNKTPETAEVVMSSCSRGSSQITTNQMAERSEAKEDDDLADYSNATISNDIHLHIRMPTGAMLQASFNMEDTLRSVKNYIDENQTSGTGSYDLAATYPRKVFSEQDMTSPLSELGLARRQSMLVVPRKQATEHLRGLPLNRSQYPVSGTDSGNINGGYFRHVRWILSYMNPLSYFGSEAAPNEPNPTIQNHLPGRATSSRTIPPNLQNSTPGDNANNPRGWASRPFGSNIHTLRQSEDEDPSADRNMFWNGNSTQYGGDDNK